MRLTPPFSTQAIVQPFGANAVAYYGSVLGLKGHPGIDFNVPWGTPIPAALQAVCSAVLSKDNPNLMAYRAVYTIFDDLDGNSYEIGYGHCSSMFAKVGSVYKEGDIVANVGNTGDVFIGDREVTNIEKMAGSHAGAHLHFQVRLLKKTLIAQLLPGAQTINNGSGRYEVGKYCYVVQNYDNGYNGCINPAQFFGSHVFLTDLKAGDTGSEVAALQTKLKELGCMAQEVVPPIFGPKTRAAVVQFQGSKGLPMTGFVGPLTRAKLNEIT